MALNLSEVEEVKQVNLFFNLIGTGAATVQSNFLCSMNNLQFQPDFCIVRQFLINSPSSGDTVIALRSDLTNDVIATTGTLFGISNPMSIIKIQKPIQQINVEFLTVPFTTAGLGTFQTPVAADFANSANVSSTIQLEFIKLKKYNPFVTKTNT